MLRSRGLLSLSSSRALSTAGAKHVTKISDLSADEVSTVLDLAHDAKCSPAKYENALHRKTLLMLFSKPSLRTRVSFETGMTQMGGHAIYYSLDGAPLGKKESIEDTGLVLERYVDAVTARVESRDMINSLAAHCSSPVINALDDFAHPCQILADLQTIREKKGTYQGLNMAYLGDARNNVTYDIMRAACMMGINLKVGAPDDVAFSPEVEVLEECEELAKIGGGSASVVTDAKSAAADADVIYTDSWMSYGIADDEKKYRMDQLLPFQVNEELMSVAQEDAIFMNCLPAMRGMEQTAEVIDGRWSVVFDQAENRLHAQKGLLMFLLK